MPGSHIHQYLTQTALSLVPAETGDNTALIRDYCLYPDEYFSRPESLSPYFFSTDGIQFHYLPDTPCNELYRYWEVGADGHLHRAKPYRNQNFLHAKNGFSFYLTKTVDLLRRGETEEGKKFLGCLLHMLEDSAFGIHSLEGPGGFDLFALDRLTDSPVPPTGILKQLTCTGLPAPDYQPRLLGGSIDETVMRLYAAYARTVSDSRKCCFQIVMNVLNKKEEENQGLVQRMFENTVKLCADAIWTVFSLAGGNVGAEKIRYLTELEPYEFPLGGFGGYCFRTYQRDTAYDSSGKPIPLEIKKENGKAVFQYGISFGSHLEGNLLYWIAPGTFREFSCVLGLHPEGLREGQVCFEVINHDAVIQEVTLSPTHPSTEIKIQNPENNFGFRMHSSRPCGIVVLGDPEFS